MKKQATRTSMKPMMFARTCRFLPILILSQVLPARERPAPELLTIDNGRIKIGIERATGASLTHLSWKAYPSNTINSHDPGRLIQQSYYAGKQLDRTADGQHQAWRPWSWNPIQGGGVGSWTRVTEFKQLNNEQSLYAETIPKLWDTGPCVHFAPVGFIELGPQSTLSYRYWLVTGTEKEIANRLNELWGKHQKESISISNPPPAKDH